MGLERTIAVYPEMETKQGGDLRLLIVHLLHQQRARKIFIFSFNNSEAVYADDSVLIF